MLSIRQKLIYFRVHQTIHAKWICWNLPIFIHALWGQDCWYKKKTNSKLAIQLSPSAWTRINSRAKKLSWINRRRTSWSLWKKLPVIDIAKHVSCHKRTIKNLWWKRWKWLTMTSCKPCIIRLSKRQDKCWIIPVKSLLPSSVLIRLLVSLNHSYLTQIPLIVNLLENQEQISSIRERR